MDLIFDIGSNNGDDIPYYLMKAKKVVAFEANPVLADEIVRRFPTHIQSGALRVENRLLVAEKDQSASEVRFYVHKHDHVMSQFPRPAKQKLSYFNTVFVGNVTLKKLSTFMGRRTMQKLT